MSRNMASIQKILKLEPIDGADQIEKATILGWKLVVKKGDFKEGDLCVYCEIDSLMPEIPEFEFLRQRKFRIKTIRLKGQISQGIAFPMIILNGKKYASDKRENPIYDIKEGDDVSSLLGIIKYEPPMPAQLLGEVKGTFPEFIPKTDETRVQILLSLIDKYKNQKCYVTEKIDGASATYYLNDGEYGVCSRNLELKINERNMVSNEFVKMGEVLKIRNKLIKLGRDIALQGELCGLGIQNNRLRMKEKKVLFFNVYDIKKEEYYSYEEAFGILKYLDLETVPILESEYLLENDVSKLITKATARSVITDECWREGIVIRPIKEIYDQEEGEGLLIRGRVSFKVINPEYLLKFDA
jgi:RNA ligase (TIGR02306 family)